MKKQIVAELFVLSVLCVGTAFGQNEKKIAYGILLDNTGSLRTQFSSVKNIGKVVVREVGKKGSIALFNFETVNKKNTTEVQVGTIWGQDEKDIYKYIDDLKIVSGGTRLSNAVFSASNAVNSKVEQEKDDFSERVLILITDGAERESNAQQKKLIKTLKEDKVKVYAIGLIEELSTEDAFGGISPKVKAKYFLKEITKETGGRVVFPKSKQTVEEIVKDLFIENIK
ncbi:MAG TPA: vWA domain-containing protein [Pyrinomonadaceae bacterium]|nr:vWA domain-containing protein [Pyrinomonadaceae bacterium]